MSILVFVAVCVVGLFATLFAGPFERASRAIAIAALAVALVCALTLGPSSGVAIGDVDLQVTAFTRLFLGALAGCGLLLALIGLMADWPERLASAALATLAALAVALSSSEPTVCLAAAALAATPAALVATRFAGTPLVATVGTTELRTLGLVVGAFLFAAATVLNPSWNTDDPTFVWAFAMVGLAAAVAVRFGAFPFHVPAANLSRSGAGLAVALSLAWIPAGLAVVALSWNVTSFGFIGEAVDRAVAIIAIAAVATLLFGAVGALLHDEVGEVAVYSIVQDAGLVLLALASREDDVAGWGRIWLVALVVAKSALIAWSETVSWAFGTSSLGELRGWARRSPILALALIAIGLGTVGWPGFPVYQARTAIVELSLPSQLHFVALAATFLSLAVYLRLLIIGSMTPSATVADAAPGWLRWPHAGYSADPEEEMPRSRGGFLGEVWHLNRPLQAALLVLIVAALAATTAFGGFGVKGASDSGIGLDQATSLGPAPADNGNQNPTPNESAAPTNDAGAGATNQPADASAQPDASTQPDASPAGS